MIRNMSGSVTVTAVDEMEKNVKLFFGKLFMR